MERKENNRRDARSELESALCTEVLRDIEGRSGAQYGAHLAGAGDLPQSVDTEMDWDDYLERYSRILTSSGRERLFGEFSAGRCLSAERAARGIFRSTCPI